MTNPRVENGLELQITPETKVANLLETYPDLENLLLSLSPKFALLKNPVLRRTAAKLATLRQAAQVGGLSIGALVSTLRAAAGQDELTVSDGEQDDSLGEPAPQDVVEEFDVRPMIERGEQPLSLVMTQLRALPPGKAIKLITPFLPAPLIDTARKQDCTVSSRQAGDGVFFTFLSKKK